jgi:EmrB/QacA subfamily drug resistance transporter
MAEMTRQPCDEGVIRAGKEGAALTEGTGFWVLVATILGSTIVFVNGSTVNVALPALQASLGATVVDMQWIVNAYTLFLAALMLLGGALGDRYGRRRVFVLGVVFFTLASVACGLATTPGFLIGARAVQGVGGALLTPGSLAIISASFRGEERGKAIGLWAGFSSLTSALGPMLGGWLIDTLSWRWIFFMHVPLALIVVAVSLWRVPESRDENAPQRLDWAGAALVTLGLGALTYGLIASSEQGFDSVLVWGSMVLGVALLVLFVVVEARQETPMMPLKLFRSRTFSGANGLTLFLYTALGGAFFFLPLNLIQVQGYSATAAGAALMPTILLLSFLSSWAGGLVTRVGAKLPLVVGPLIAAVGFYLLALPGVGGSYWTTFFPGLVVLGLGLAVSVAPLTTAVMTSVPDEYAGAASGINNAVARLAGLLAVAALGVVMLQVFSNNLATELARTGLPQELQETVLARRAELGSLTMPEAMGAEQEAAAQAAVDRAFVAGFRVIAYITAGLALVSALVAGVMVEGRQRGRAEVGGLEIGD